MSILSISDLERASPIVDSGDALHIASKQRVYVNTLEPTSLCVTSLFRRRFSTLCQLVLNNTVGIFARSIGQISGGQVNRLLADVFQCSRRYNSHAFIVQLGILNNMILYSNCTETSSNSMPSGQSLRRNWLHLFSIHLLLSIPSLSPASSPRIRCRHRTLED